jgi:small-conductance mechanosensitive channel
LDGQEVVISNANLLNKEVHNFALLEHRRFHLMIGVTYQTPVETLRAIPGTIRGLVDAHEHFKMVRCALVNFGASSLDFELVFDVHSTDFEYTFSAKGDLIVEILGAFNKAGVEFAYPTQTTFTAAPDGTLVMPYADLATVGTGHADAKDQAAKPSISAGG